MKLLNLFADKNLENTANSGGRSMVEMLGVLAIIGVLSVGGIVGYNTAMYKHRMNKTIQTFSQMFSNAIEISNERGMGNFSGRQNMIDYDLLSEEQCPVSTRNSNYCRFPVGEVNAYLYRHSYVEGNFQIYFYDGDIVKNCVDFLSQGWQNMYPQDWLLPKNALTNGGSGSYIYVSGKQNKYLWAFMPEGKSGAKKDNITLSDVQTACDTCQGRSYCQISMYINW